MLVLCSNGLSSKEMLSYIRDKVSACKTAALVVTADNEYKESNYHVSRCTAELESLNLNVDVFDLDKQPAELLLDYDVVEFIGGNPYYLLHSIRENNAAEILRDIAMNRVLIGWSAAAFGLTDLRGLSLTQVQILPHYNKFLSRFEKFEERCCGYEKEHNVRVIRINDGEGVFIDRGIHICRL